MSNTQKLPEKPKSGDWGSWTEEERLNFVTHLCQSFFGTDRWSDMSEGKRQDWIKMEYNRCNGIYIGTLDVHGNPFDD